MACAHAPTYSGQYRRVDDTGGTHNGSSPVVAVNVVFRRFILVEDIKSARSYRVVA